MNNNEKPPVITRKTVTLSQENQKQFNERLHGKLNFPFLFVLFAFVLFFYSVYTHTDWKLVREVPTNKESVSFVAKIKQQIPAITSENTKIFSKLKTAYDESEVQAQEESLAEPDKSLDSIIASVSNKFNVKPIVIKAIIEQESQYNPDVIKYEQSWESQYAKTTKRKPGENLESWKLNFHSIGLMQIGYILHKDFCELNSYTDLFNPEKNITCGTKIFAECLKKSDKTTCIRNYNGRGPKAEKYKNEVMARISRLMTINKKVTS